MFEVLVTCHKIAINRHFPTPGSSTEDKRWDADKKSGSWDGCDVANDFESYLNMYDSGYTNWGSDGNYYDSEIASDLDLFRSDVRITLITDNYQTGGIGPEIQALNNENIFFLAACSGNGLTPSTNDDGHPNSAFTYYLLKNLEFEDSFEWAFWRLIHNHLQLKEWIGPWVDPADASIEYYKLANTPQIFDGNIWVEHLTNPTTTSTDSDSDGLTDFDEVSIYRTSPIEQDTEGDDHLDGTDPHPLNWDAYCPQDPITIDDNTDFFAQASSRGWRSTGAATNPIIIVNYNSTSASSTLLMIKNTDLYFCVKDNIFNGIDKDSTGIFLQNVTHATITNNTFFNNNVSIYLEDAVTNLITTNTVHSTTYGIGLLSTTTNNALSYNTWCGIGLLSATENTITFD